jgi:hypothetical protein
MVAIASEGSARLVRFAAALVMATCLGAADFDFSTIIRAGRPTNATFELGIGPLTNNTLVRGHVNQPNYFPNGLPNRFEIGYTSATNSAYLRYFYGPGVYREVVYSPGGTGLQGGSVWTIPRNSLFVAATSRPVPTSVTIANLQFGAGVQVLQPFTTTTLTAAQNGGNVRTNMPGLVRFRTGASGDWLLSGTISFAGLRFYTPRGAIGNQLRMGAGFSGTDVPEAGTWLLALTGLCGIVFAARLRSGQSAVSRVRAALRSPDRR